MYTLAQIILLLFAHRHYNKYEYSPRRQRSLPDVDPRSTSTLFQVPSYTATAITTATIIYRRTIYTGYRYPAGRVYDDRETRSAAALGRTTLRMVGVRPHGEKLVKTVRNSFSLQTPFSLPPTISSLSLVGPYEGNFYFYCRVCFILFSVSHFFSPDCR